MGLVEADGAGLTWRVVFEGEADLEVDDGPRSVGPGVEYCARAEPPGWDGLKGVKGVAEARGFQSIGGDSAADWAELSGDGWLDDLELADLVTDTVACERASNDCSVTAACPLQTVEIQVRTAPRRVLACVPMWRRMAAIWDMAFGFSTQPLQMALTGWRSAKSHVPALSITHKQTILIPHSVQRPHDAAGSETKNNPRAVVAREL